MIIQKQNGTSFDIADYGLIRLFHHIPSASITHTSLTVEGRGDIITSSTIGGRTISVEFGFRVTDIYDYYLLRDELNALFLLDEPFYIIFKREPYKRWKVRLSGQFMVEPTTRIKSFTVDFVTEKPFAESVGTSLDLQNRKESDVNLWGHGMGIDSDKEYFYRFASNDFVVDNIGNVAVNPRMHDLEITLKGTFSSSVKITNKTTGDVFQYNRGLSSTDELKVKGVRTLKNGVSDFKNTNKKLLTLATGNNQISVEGGTVESIAFNFRFLYK